MQQTIQALQNALGREFVSTDDSERAFFSQDVYRSGVTAAAIIRPGSTEELSKALQAIATSGVAIVPRGGGMSYTDGYLPARPDTVMVDMQRMNRVLSVNPDNMYVTVQCGANWKDLYDALAPQGVRTPYYGPLSGLRATIGGALSQGSIFLGSGRYGTAADAVIGLDVVLVDGTVLHLGSHANKHGEPFFRQFGPDTLGSFLSDCGALGIKTVATLRLIRPLPESRFLSFAFDGHVPYFAAMAEVARADVASEQFGFDPGLEEMRMKRVSLAEDVKSLGKVVKAGGSLVQGLKEGARVVLAGRNFIGGKFSLHLSLDGRDGADADGKAALVRSIMSRTGKEIENSIPKVMRANPFAEVNSMLGPSGERWVPVHGIVPFSRGAAMYEGCESVFTHHQSAMQQFKIHRGYLSCTIGGCGTLLEPVLYWPAERLGFHERVLDAAYLAKLERYPANPDATAAVARLREDLASAFLKHGAASFQIGKFYKYQDGLDSSAASWLRQLKHNVDPQGRMNPGSLGL